MKSCKFFMFVLVASFLFNGCGEYSACLEKKSCSYDAQCFEHILNYTTDDGFHSVCLEESFDLAEGEIVGFRRQRRSGGISFILYTEKGYYILNCNRDGTLVLYRMN